MTNCEDLKEESPLSIILPTASISSVPSSNQDKVTVVTPVSSSSSVRNDSVSVSHSVSVISVKYSTSLDDQEENNFQLINENGEEGKSEDKAQNSQVKKEEESSGSNLDSVLIDSDSVSPGDTDSLSVIDSGSVSNSSLDRVSQTVRESITEDKKENVMMHENSVSTTESQNISFFQMNSVSDISTTTQSNNNHTSSSTPHPGNSSHPTTQPDKTSNSQPDPTTIESEPNNRTRIPKTFEGKQEAKEEVLDTNNIILDLSTTTTEKSNSPIDLIYYADGEETLSDLYQEYNITQEYHEIPPNYYYDRDESEALLEVYDRVRKEEKKQIRQHHSVFHMVVGIGLGVLLFITLGISKLVFNVIGYLHYEKVFFLRIVVIGYLHLQSIFGFLLVQYIVKKFTNNKIK